MKQLPLEAQRLVELPIEEPIDAENAAQEYTRAYAHSPNAPTMTLRPIQGQMLAEAKRAGGLVAMAACGEGKTLTSLLLPSVLGAKRPLILLPASMRAQYMSDRASYGEHFRLVDMPCMSYEGLSSPGQVAKLDELAPDLIICDEAHHLKNLRSARVRRLESYLLKSGALFCALSGTLVSRSLREYAHVANWALGVWSPLPRPNDLIEAWARVIEDKDALKTQRAWHDASAWRFDTDPERALHKRLRCARGVVITRSQEVGASLVIERRSYRQPTKLKEAISKLLETQDVVSATHDVLTPEALERIVDSRDLWTPQDAVYSRVWAQVAMGFVYVWEWGGRAPDTEWIEARRAWSSAVQWGLDRFGYDSEALLKRAIVKGEITHKRLTGAFDAWEAVSDRPAPTTKAIWLDDTWARDIATWATKQDDPPLVWVGLHAVADKIASLTGAAVYGGGAEASARLNERKDRAHLAVVSIASHGTGKNLQAWGRQIVAHPLAHPARWEQMLARTHRPGQLRDEVSCAVYAHGLFGRAFRRAVDDARYVYETTGQKQRLTYAVQKK
jgi:hypothetical protein